MASTKLSTEALLEELKKRGFGGRAFSDTSTDPLADLFRNRGLEKYTLDPSMGEQKLRTQPREYGPGGGGVFFTGGSPFKVDKDDQRILAQGAMANTLVQMLMGAQERPQPGIGSQAMQGPAPDQYNGGYYPNMDKIPTGQSDYGPNQPNPYEGLTPEEALIINEHMLRLREGQ